MRTLIISCSKLSFFFFLCLALPVLLEAKQILSLWLVEVPDHSVTFLRLVFFIMLIESWEQPLHTANLATGKIKVFQSVKGITLLMTLPIAYIALKMGARAEVVFIVQLLVSFGSLIIQLFIIRPLIGLSLRQYYFEVFGRTFIVTIVSAIIPLLVFRFLEDNILSMILVVLVSVLSVLGTVYIMGLNASEKAFVSNSIQINMSKIFHKK